MSLEIRLYGKFKKLAKKTDESSDKIGIITVENDKFKKIIDVLKYLEIDEEEVSHIFLDGEYSHQNRKIRKGERLAIFPEDMALLYKWYFSPKKE